MNNVRQFFPTSVATDKTQDLFILIRQTDISFPNFIRYGMLELNSNVFRQFGSWGEQIFFGSVTFWAIFNIFPSRVKITIWTSSHFRDHDLLKDWFFLWRSGMTFWKANVQVFVFDDPSLPKTIFSWWSSMTFQKVNEQVLIFEFRGPVRRLWSSMTFKNKH